MSSFAKSPRNAMLMQQQSVDEVDSEDDQELKIEFNLSKIKGQLNDPLRCFKSAGRAVLAGKYTNIDFFKIPKPDHVVQ